MGMHKYLTLLSDFDGTLVTASHSLPTNTLNAIRGMVAGGNQFSIVTGRAFQGVIEREVKRLGLTTPQIVRGGAEIIDPMTREVLWTKKIDKHSVLKVLDLLNSYSVIYAVEVGDMIYSFPQHPAIKNLGEGAPVIDITQFIPIDVPKIVVFPELDIVFANEIEKELRSLQINVHLAKIHKDNCYGFDINDASAGKHLAVLQYMQLTNLTSEEIVGVGDGDNDYPLLTACGFKVAMGNAVDDLKQIADYIAPSVQEEGIVDVINRYF